MNFIKRLVTGQGKRTWSMDEALGLIRRIQPDCMENGYYLALGGGVLNKGYSDKNLDLVAMPRTCSSQLEKLIGSLIRGSVYIREAKHGDCWTMWRGVYIPDDRSLPLDINIPHRYVPSTEINPCLFVYE